MQVSADPFETLTICGETYISGSISCPDVHLELNNCKCQLYILSAPQRSSQAGTSPDDVKTVVKAAIINLPKI